MEDSRGGGLGRWRQPAWPGRAIRLRVHPSHDHRKEARAFRAAGIGLRPIRPFELGIMDELEKRVRKAEERGDEKDADGVFGPA